MVLALFLREDLPVALQPAPGPVVFAATTPIEAKSSEHLRTPVIELRLLLSCLVFYYYGKKVDSI